MGLAALRRDGIVSLNAGEEAGVVITRPLAFEGEGELFINADVGTNGCVRASVVAEDGGAIEGFGEDDCRPVCGDSTRSCVGWGSNKTLAGLKDRYVSLAFLPDECETVFVLDRVERCGFELCTARLGRRESAPNSTFQSVFRRSGEATQDNQSLTLVEP